MIFQRNIIQNNSLIFLGLPYTTCGIVKKMVVHTGGLVYIMRYRGARKKGFVRQRKNEWRIHISTENDRASIICNQAEIKYFGIRPNLPGPML